MMQTTQRGYLLVLVMVFGAIFFMMLVALMGFVVNQKQVQEIKRHEEMSLAIAEAGLNYYKWFLARHPDDVQNGEGVPGPYVIPYNDPETGEAIGEYSLQINPDISCNQIMAIDIESTGYSYENPDRSRTLYARYAQPSVAEFSYIIDSNVWAGSDRVIIGPYHSNGVVRMDGTNNSTVSSGVEEWACASGSSPSCSPTGSMVDGVYGNGPNDEFWIFPSTPIDFNSISVNLSDMKTSAQSDGRYFGDSGDYGYLLDFQNNDTFNLYRVTGTRSHTESDDGGSSSYTARNIVTNTSLVSGSPFSIPTDCPLVFIEESDRVWVQGEVSTKVSLAVATVGSGGTASSPTIILGATDTTDGNLIYTEDDAGLLAIAENDVLVGVNVPNNMTVEGIFVAQEGRFGRMFYNSLPSGYSQYEFRNSLDLHGTVVSNERTGTKWGSATSYSSGFEFRTNTYDRDLVEDPPPLTPSTAVDYQFVDWREVD